MTNMRSHTVPVVHQTKYLIASWDDCGKSRYSGPCPTREPTAADAAEDGHEDALLALMKRLNQGKKV